MTTRLRNLGLPATLLVSSLAALTTWVTLLAWTPFSERPNSYMLPLAGAALLVAGSGALLRSARFPAAAVLVGQLVVVGGWLHRRWAEEEAWGGWLPTRESLGEVATTVAEGARAAQAFAAPVPASATEFAPLLIVSGVCTLLLVDFVACGLRRAPVAGLPLLAAYTAPISILDGGVGWPKFAGAALCFLFLIAAQEATRVGRWGRQVTEGRLFDSQTTEFSNHTLWSSARKIGVTATGLSVLVPLLVPTLSLGVFSGFGSGPGGDGDSVSLSNPMVDMRRDLSQGLDRDLLTLSTEDPDPSYLRITVLDTFDGDAWRPSERQIPQEQLARGLMPRPPGLSAAVPRDVYDWTIHVESGFESKWLPAPYPVFSIDAPGDWRYDRDTLDFISADPDQDAADLTYRLEGIRISPSAQQLADAGAAPATVFQPMTELPEMPDSVGELARQVTDEAQTKFEQAVALQRWFRVGGDFEYSLDQAPGNGLDELERFLLEGRTGYCEQFATAMALMGRSLAIPSRVAVGFLKPESTDDGDLYVYSSHDLHAWPEMYFADIGWVRFEPTPGARAPGVPAYTRQDIRSDDPTAPSGSQSAVPPGLNRLDRLSPGTDAGAGGPGGSGNATGLLVGLGLGAALVLALLLPRVARATVRRRRWAAAASPVQLAEACWAELRATALDHGVAWDDSVTVRSRARDLVRSFGRPGGEQDALRRPEGRGAEANPEAARALERLVRLVEMARYARRVPPSAAEVGAARTDVDLCVSALRAGASRRSRTRAAWAPASLLADWREVTGAASRRADVRLDEPGVDHAV